jgi:hypothetical protein
MKAAREWFRQIWPRPAGKHNVLSGYAMLRDERHVLADIALRNRVFKEFPKGLNAFDAGVCEGRRQAALEILELCSLDPALLWEVIEAKDVQPKQERRTAP